jgi:hypothetical protein
MPDPFDSIPSTPRNLASTAPPRVFAQASVQTTDGGYSPIVSNASHVPNSRPTSDDNPRKRSHDEDGSEQAEGLARPLTRRRTGLGSGELMPPTPLRRSSGSTNI